MRWKAVLVSLLLVLLAVPVSAQTVNPCDQTFNTTTPAKGTIIGLCESTTDVDGNPITVYNFHIYIDGTLAATITNAIPTVSTPSAGGMIFFQYTLPPASRAIHQLSADFFDALGISVSSNTAAWQVGNVGKAPKNTGVTK